MNFETFEDTDVSAAQVIFEWALILLVIGSAVGCMCTGDPDAEAKRTWPERCRKACRENALKSAAPREAFGLCVEGCP